MGEFDFLNETNDWDSAKKMIKEKALGEGTWFEVTDGMLEELAEWWINFSNRNFASFMMLYTLAQMYAVCHERGYDKGWVSTVARRW